MDYLHILPHLHILAQITTAPLPPTRCAKLLQILAKFGLLLTKSKPLHESVQWIFVLTHEKIGTDHYPTKFAKIQIFVKFRLFLIQSNFFQICMLGILLLTHAKN